VIVFLPFYILKEALLVVLLDRDLSNEQRTASIANPHHPETDSSENRHIFCFYIILKHLFYNAVIILKQRYFNKNIPLKGG
tara:strand:+ start:4092 stop:4334 length:243 start_codon:yes stop_codon:yes gene_type:complete